MQQEARSAARHFVQVDGNHIRVDRAGGAVKGTAGAPATHFDKNRSVFVGNLAFDVEVS